jgi:hypothetical protein
MLIESIYEQGLFHLVRTGALADKNKSDSIKQSSVTDSNDSASSTQSGIVESTVKWTWRMEDVVNMRAHDDIVHLMLARFVSILFILILVE